MNFYTVFSNDKNAKINKMDLVRFIGALIQIFLELTLSLLVDRWPAYFWSAGYKWTQDWRK